MPPPISVAPFTEQVGPKVLLPESPLEIFSLLFTSHIIDHIVQETNKYAEQCLRDSDKEWATNSEEIKAYLGFSVLMGVVRQPEIRDYWSKSDLLHYSPIASRISRRFEEISRFFHLADNTTPPQRGQPGFHRLQKVKEVLDLVRKQFMAVYNPRACLSVDEAMIPFKGETRFIHIEYIIHEYLLTCNVLCNAYCVK